MAGWSIIGRRLVQLIPIIIGITMVSSVLVVVRYRMWWYLLDQC